MYIALIDNLFHLQFDWIQAEKGGGKDKLKKYKLNSKELALIGNRDTSGCNLFSYKLKIILYIYVLYTYIKHILIP